MSIIKLYWFDVVMSRTTYSIDALHGSVSLLLVIQPDTEPINSTGRVIEC